MCRTIIFHNYRIIHRNIGGALLKFADWISRACITSLTRVSATVTASPGVESDSCTLRFNNVLLRDAGAGRDVVEKDFCNCGPQVV
jgi:hypothetical protein